MVDLIVKDLVGNVEMLVGASVTRKKSDSAEKYITVTISENKDFPDLITLNTEAFDMMKNQCFLIYKTDEYVIKKVSYKTIGKYKKATVTAYAKFHEDFNCNRKYETITGTYRINNFCDFIFKDSGYEYEIDSTDIILSVEVENFGDDSLLNLLNSMANKFEVEYEVEGKKVYIAKTLSRYLDEQMRYEFNINDPNLELDSTDLRTYIRGYGKQDEETGKYLAYQEYTSPLEQVYGIKHAKPVRDERFTNNDSLLKEMKSELVDYIDMSLTLTAVDLEEMGITDVKKGDYVWCIIEPFEINLQLRVVEVEDYSDESASPKFTFGSLKKTATQIINDWKEAKKTLNKIVKNGSVIETALPMSVKNSTQAVATVSNSLTFTAQGLATTMPSDMTTYSVIPDVLFGNGQIQTAGMTAVSKEGLNLAAVYGELPGEIIEQIKADVDETNLLKKINALETRVAELESNRVIILDEGGTTDA